MNQRPLRVAKRAIDVALEAVPGSVVERVTAATAPLTRYSGRTQAGTAALASALAVLAQPPRARQRRASRLTLDKVAAHVGQPLDVVQRWADEGLLGTPLDDGAWSSDVLDRATLLVFAHRHGTSDDELKRAVAEGRLPLLTLEHVIAGEPTLSARDVARRAGVPLEMALAIWRALGMPTDDVDERAFTRDEVAALRTLNAMRSVFTEEDLIEAASVVGRAMADVASASVELFRRRLTARFIEAGVSELEVALRLAAMVDLLVPPLGPLLEVVLRRHLTVSTRAEAAMQIEQSDAAALSQRELTVAFADLVGFTTMSEHLSALEVSRLAARLLHCAESVLPRHEARLVKSIGDAVMFTARDPVSCCRAAIDLIEAAGNEDGLPPVRVGAAHGPVLRAYADYFGRTVNLAARLCDTAPAGAVLLHAPETPVTPEAWKAAGLTAKPGGSLKLKGIETRIPVIRVTATANS
jgi:adenylate cyclase